MTTDVPIPPPTREAIIELLNEEFVAVLVDKALNGTLLRFLDARGVSALSHIRIEASHPFGLYLVKGVPALFTFVLMG